MCAALFENFLCVDGKVPVGKDQEGLFQSAGFCPVPDVVGFQKSDSFLILICYNHLLSGFSLLI